MIAFNQAGGQGVSVETYFDADGQVWLMVWNKDNTLRTQSAMSDEEATSLARCLLRAVADMREYFST